MLPAGRQSLNADDSEGCWWLAACGGGGAAVVCALFFRGWVVAGHRLDVVPAVVAALVTALAVQSLGRQSGWRHAVTCGVWTLLGLAAGYSLAWDLFGVVGAQSGGVEAAAGWTDRLREEWQARTDWERIVNGLSYVFAPCLAMAVVPLCRRLEAMGVGTALPAGSGRDAELGVATPVEVRRGCRVAALVWSLGVLIASLVWGGGERSGFLRLTFPCEPFHAAQPLIGFSYLLGGEPIMAEEVPALEQVDWFSGAVRSDNNFRFLRAGYAFLAVHFAPWLGREGALLVVNIASWCVCMASVWALCRHVFRDETAAAIAVCLAATGIGPAIHLHSFGPHLCGFALYFCGVAWLAVSGIASERRPWRTHCLSGLGLGLIGVVYNVGPMLLAVYLWNGWRRQRWLYLAGGAALALGVRPVWRYILPALGINVVDVEADYAAAALRAWGDWWEIGVGTFLWHSSRLAVDSAAACDSPAVLVLGGMAAILAPTTWRDRLFGLSVLGAPVLAATVFAPAAGARGYIVYGMSIWLYCCSGAWLAWGVARGRGMAALSLIVLGMALAAQVGWSTAHWGGWLGPAKTYFLGWDDGWPVLRNEPTQVVSLTGEEPTPVAFGGGETLVEAGAVVEPAAGLVPRKSRVLAWLSRFPLLFGLLLWGGAWFPKRRGRRWLTAWAIVQLVIGGECSHRRLDNVPTPYVPQGAVTLAAGETATLRLRVATEGQATMRERFRKGESRLGLFVPASGPLRLSLAAGGATAPLNEEDTGFFAITDTEAALEVLEQAEWELTLRAAGSEPVTFTGWQRRGLPGRELTGGDGVAQPVVELRLIRREDGFLEAAAF